MIKDDKHWPTEIIKSVLHAAYEPAPGSGLIEISRPTDTIELELFSKNTIESMFMDILMLMLIPDKYGCAVQYLYFIYNNSIQELRNLPKRADQYELKVKVLTNLRELAACYALLGIVDESMFARNDIEFTVRFLLQNVDEVGPFLSETIDNAISEDTLLEYLDPLVPTLSSYLSRTNLDSKDYSKCLSLYEMLLSAKPVAAIFSQIPTFFPPNNNDSLSFEKHSLLGAVLKLSPLNKGVATFYFGEDPSAMSKTEVRSISETIQNEYTVLIARLFSLIDKMVRGSPQTRNDVMKWFASLVNASHLRKGSHADPNKLASDGLMMNISVILVKLSAPFLDFPRYLKIDKIDVNYFSKSKLLDVAEESRINSSASEANKYFENLASEQGVNFISDCFYLTLTYLHYGIGGIPNFYDRATRQIEQVVGQIATLSQRSGIQNPREAAMLGMFKSMVGGLVGTKHATTALFEHRKLHLEIFDFIVGATTYLTRLIDPAHKYPESKISIPIFKISRVAELDDHEFLMTKAPEPWKYFPEYFIEGIVEYCRFLSRFRGSPMLFNEDRLTTLIEFTVILLRCPELVGNPHLKANLIEILSYGTMPIYSGPNARGFMMEIFNHNALVSQNLLYSLLDLYVMVEKTGTSNQFYDKFNSRYRIAEVIESLWNGGNPIYRQQLVSYSKTGIDFFVRFIARMLNDTTFLLDEAFESLNKIHMYQQELKRRNAGQAEDTEEFGTTDELQKKLQDAERTAKSFMGLSNKTMELFKLFTKEVPQGFVLDELVDRLAGMLDYNLGIMVGPKCSTIKVESPEKYGFEPKRTLGDLCQIYCNLAEQEKFAIACSRDGRSFHIELFRKAERILSTKTYVDSMVIQGFIHFAEKAEKLRQAEVDEETELGEIPDEFLDPLMFSLMEDPVILPTSKVSIDRSTIKSHLLSDPTDPFNRAPLKLEDVIDDVELKQRITDFKKERKHQKNADGDIEMK